MWFSAYRTGTSGVAVETCDSVIIETGTSGTEVDRDV